MSDSPVRLVALGSLTGLLTGIFVALPATAAARAIVVAYYQPTALELAKLSFCGRLDPGSCTPAPTSFWALVLPLGVAPLIAALLSGTALGVLFVIVRRYLPGRGLFWAPAFGLGLALVTLLVGPGGIYVHSPWETAFDFLPYPGMYTLPNRLLLALPIFLASIGMGVFAHVLDGRLVTGGGPAVRWAYGGLAVVGCVGLLLLPLAMGLVYLGD